MIHWLGEHLTVWQVFLISNLAPLPALWLLKRTWRRHAD
jgi:hypothetical protein